MDMRYHWLTDRVRQKQFDVYWRPGRENYHSANSAVTHNEDQITKATIGALSNLAPATAADRGVVEALTQANSCLAKKLEDNSTKLRELRDLLH
jgi:hypothetical protein